MNSYAALRPLLDGQRMLAPMFYLGYMVSEFGAGRAAPSSPRSASASASASSSPSARLSKGLDDAQDEGAQAAHRRRHRHVGYPPAEVRSATVTGRAASRRRSASQLEQENGPRALRPQPTRPSRGRSSPAPTSCRPRSSASRPRRSPRSPQLDGVRTPPGSLTLNAVTIKGTVPKNGFQRPQQGPPAPSRRRRPDAGRAPFDIDSLSVTGVDESKPELAAVAPASSPRRTCARPPARPCSTTSYARRNGLKVGDDDLARRQEVHGHRPRAAPRSAARPPTPTSSSRSCRQLSDRAGRVNSRPGAGRLDRRRRRGREGDQGDDDAARRSRPRPTSPTASAARSSDAKNLSGKLGTALTIVALVAAFLIATLLTLSSVTKRIRELGTLKALGWPGRTVVRQVTGESVAAGRCSAASSAR